MKAISLSPLVLTTLINDGWEVRAYQRQKGVDWGIEKGAARIRLTKASYDVAFGITKA